MDRAEFEALRDLPGKRIDVDIILTRGAGAGTAQRSQRVPIVNGAGVLLQLDVTYNPQTNAKIMNVSSRTAGGPICRLCVDSTVHKADGRDHKHSLRTPECPSNNLPFATARPELRGATIQQVLAVFCEEANITLNGQLRLPA